MSVNVIIGCCCVRYAVFISNRCLLCAMLLLMTSSECVCAVRVTHSMRAIRPNGAEPEKERSHLSATSASFFLRDAARSSRCLSPPLASHNIITGASRRGRQSSLNSTRERSQLAEPPAARSRQPRVCVFYIVVCSRVCGASRVFG